MTIKSLTITEDAYTALKTLKHGDESFSEVILRISSEKIGQAAKFFGMFSDDKKSAQEFEKNITSRRKQLETEFTVRKQKIRHSLS